MPKNKNALIRYKLINQLLVNGKMASKSQMADTCAERLGLPVSLRTIENDIYNMRYSEGLGYFAPIEYEHSKNGYVYTNPDYSIDRIPLDDDDMNKLRFAASLLRQYKKVEAFWQFSGAIDKVIRLISYHKTHGSDKKLDFIEFEKNPPVRGMEFIDQLIRCILEKQVISLRHHSFWQDETQEFTVHPFYLKEHKFRWYLVGWCEERKDVRIFGLERIQRIAPLPLKEFTCKLFNPELYFEKFIGVNVPRDPPQKVVLRFFKNVGKYIHTQPVHHSQKLLRNEGDVHDFEYRIAVNQEFIGIILGWRENVVVLQPADLRDEIMEIIGKMKGKYK